MKKSGRKAREGEKPSGGRHRRETRTVRKKTPSKTTVSAANSKVPADFDEARKDIATLVRMSANEIAARFIELAKEGQLAPAKYLFEVAGLYPAIAETPEKPENSLAYTLLKRLGLPTEPVKDEEESGSEGD